MENCGIFFLAAVPQMIYWKKYMRSASYEHEFT